MPRHIHMHLHGPTMSGVSHDVGLKRPPSSVIKPTPNALHNPPKNTSGIKPIKASAGVIKAAPVKVIKGATKGVNLLNKGIRKIGELSESKI